MTHMKKSLLSIALFVCGLLLWKPVQAEAATQVDNLVLMVNFSEDGANTFQTNFSRYQEMYTGPESEPNLESIYFNHIGWTGDGKYLFPTGGE